MDGPVRLFVWALPWSQNQLNLEAWGTKHKLRRPAAMRSPVQNPHARRDAGLSEGPGRWCPIYMFGVPGPSPSQVVRHPQPNHLTSPLSEAMDIDTPSGVGPVGFAVQVPGKDQS